MNTIAIIQARMSSTRLPGKVLMPLGPWTALELCYRRVEAAKLVDRVIIATTTNQADDIIWQTCKENDWPCYRGSEDDVLGRVYECAKANDADVIVDVTSDCPFVSPGHIDYLINKRGIGNCDYVSNDVIDRSWPDGLDCQVYKFHAIQRVHDLYETEDAEFRGASWEHSGWNIAKPYHDKFKIAHWKAPDEFNHPELSLSLDTVEDYVFLQSCLRSMVGYDFDVEVLLRYIIDGTIGVTNAGVNRKWRGAGG